MPQPPPEPYHIYTRTNGSENLFREDENYFYLLRKYARYIYPIAETYAYCLMPNHLRLIVKVGMMRPCSKFSLRNKKT